MLWLAAAALAASAPHSPSGERVGPSVQAIATVRILSGVQLKLDGQANPEAPPARESSIRAEGSSKRVILIQFE